MPPTSSLPQHLTNLDWPTLEQSLDQDGCAVIRNLLPPLQCRQLAGLYAEPSLFRSRVIMARHGFGRGEYQYFRYPLPDLIQQLRQSLYPALVPLANRWNEHMGIEVRYPHEHADFIQRCHAAGQQRPTPLLLQYGPQDYNCLHQDLYGEIFFPMQLVLFLDEPGKDYDGGEFVLIEQRPRAQSKAIVLKPGKGDTLLFTTNFRPVKGNKGYYRVNMKHGVSEVTHGQRHTLGIIFHDAA